MESRKKKNLIPILIALPSLGLGCVWYMGSTIITLLVERITPSASELGLLMSMASVTGLFAPYLAGVISDRTNTRMGKRKPWVLLGAIVASIFLILMGTATSYIEIFIFAFIVFLMVNFYQGAYYSWMPEAVEEDQIGIVNGWGKLFYAIGGIIIYGVGTILFNMNPMYPLIIAMLFVLVPTLIASFTVKEDPTKFAKPTKISFDFLKNQAAMKLFIATAFAMLAYGLISPYYIPYFEKTGGFSSVEVSIALMICTLAGLLSVFFGILCDKYSKQKMVLLAFIIEIVGFAVGIFVMNNIGMLWGFAIILGCGVSIFQVSFYAMIPAIAPKGKLGEYMGINNIFLSVPQIIGNNIGGYLMGAGFLGVIFPLAIICLVVACLIIGIGKMKFPKDASGPLQFRKDKAKAA